MEYGAPVAEGELPWPGRLIPRRLLEEPPELVAPRLLGKLLIHRTPAGILAGRIIECEAYLGPHCDPPDPAAHAFRGVTPRNRVLFGPAGHAYVYAIYGRYLCMNISCEPEGRAGCVLVRALEPVAGVERMGANRGVDPSRLRLLTSGPGRLSEALGLSRSRHNGLDLTSGASPLELRDDGSPGPAVLATVRIGIRHAVDLPLRFQVRGHPLVSGPRSLNGDPVRTPARAS